MYVLFLLIIYHFKEQIEILQLQQLKDGTVLSQSQAFTQFVGKECGFYPTDDNMKAFKCDEILGGLDDLRRHIYPTFTEQDEEKKMAMRRKLYEETIPHWANLWDKLIARNNEGKEVKTATGSEDLTTVSS